MKDQAKIADSRFGYWINFVVFGSAAAPTALGLMVLVGWYAHNVTLVQVHPTFVPMQYNTALGFLLCGAGLLFIVFNRPRMAGVVGGLAAVIGFLTLIEYSAGVDLGIDQLLMEHYITVKTSHPGRMAPNTALSFFLTGSSLVLMGSWAHFKLRSLVLGLLGSLIVALGTVSFFGYIGGVSTAYGWGRMTRMAIHTAAGFMVLGAGILAYAWYENHRVERTWMPRWTPILAGVGVAIISLLLWQALVALEDQYVDRLIQDESVTLANHLKNQLDDRVLGLILMAKRWESHGGMSKAEWEVDATSLVAHQPGYQAIEWVDPSYHVRWILPLEGNEGAVGLNLAFEERRRIALDKSRQRRDVTVTRSIDLVQGGKGFLVYVPIFLEDQFGGFILGVFQIKHVFDHFLKDNPTHYNLVLLDGDNEIYRKWQSKGEHIEARGREVPLDFYGVLWRLKVVPTSDLLGKVSSAIPAVILVVGMLIAGLIAMLVYLVQATRLRSLDLEQEIIERKRAEEELLRAHRALNTLSHGNQAVVRATEESELLQEMCRVIVEVGGYRLAWVGFTEQDEAKSVRPVAQAGYEEGYLETLNITWADTERGRGPTGTAIQTGTTCVTQNVLTHPEFELWRAEAIERGYASSIALPLLDGEGAFGALSVYAAEPDAFDAEELKLLEELAKDLAYGIKALRTRAEHKQAEEALRKRTHELGERVKELNCLYTIYGLVEKWGTSLDEIFQGTVDIIPPSWQYPEITRARIILENQAFQTEDFAETIWKQASDIFVHGKRIGTLEVFYLEEKPEIDEGPFLKEERHLIDAIAGQLRKIIESKRAEDEKRQAQALAISSEKLAAVGRLTAGVSHEVLNPLNFILLCVQRLLDDPDIDPELAEDLREMETQSNRIAKISHDLLYFSRQRTPERRPIDLNEAVRRTLALL